jgi:hypothetical protein
MRIRCAQRPTAMHIHFLLECGILTWRPYYSPGRRHSPTPACWTSPFLFLFAKATFGMSTCSRMIPRRQWSGYERWSWQDSLNDVLKFMVCNGTFMLVEVNASGQRTQSKSITSVGGKSTLKLMETGNTNIQHSLSTRASWSHTDCCH